MPEPVKSVLESLAKSAPSLIGYVLLTSMFLWHINSMAALDNLVAKQRIAACHDIKEQSNKVMDNLAEAMQLQALAFKELSVRLERITD